ncbi:MAG: DUF1194 domain-containing protein [Solirubrobacterales bacterium]
MRWAWAVAGLLLVTVPAHAAIPVAAIPVDVALVLLVDVSMSIDPAEYALQKGGTAKAFRDPRLAAAIEAGPLGRIAVTYVEWDRTPEQMVPWTVIDGAPAAEAFARLVEATRRHAGGASTGMAAALTAATGLLADPGLQATRKVIDVSGDGAENTGADAADARDQALAQGVSAVNGIVVGKEEGPRRFYAEDVVGGARSFLVTAEDFDAYEDAILRKLVLEIVAN